MVQNLIDRQYSIRSDPTRRGTHGIEQFNQLADVADIATGIAAIEGIIQFAGFNDLVVIGIKEVEQGFAFALEGAGKINHREQWNTVDTRRG